VVLFIIISHDEIRQFKGGLFRPQRLHRSIVIKGVRVVAFMLDDILGFVLRTCSIPVGGRVQTNHL